MEVGSGRGWASNLQSSSMDQMHVLLLSLVDLAGTGERGCMSDNDCQERISILVDRLERQESATVLRRIGWGC